MHKFWWMYGPLREAAGEGGEGGGGNGGTPPPAVTEDAMKKFVNDTLNAHSKRIESKFKPLEETIGALNDTLKKLNEGQQPPPEKKEGDGKGSKPEENATILQLQREVANLRKKQEETEAEAKKVKEEAEVNDRKATIRSLLAGKQWASQKAEESFFNAVFGEIVRGEDGSLIANGLPAKAYIEEQLQQPDWQFALAASGKGGAGAEGGRPRTSKVDINDIKAGMSPETKRAALAELARVAAGR